MKSKLLSALKAKFEGVSEQILDRVASKYAQTITSEAQVETAVAGITLQQVIESYGDSRATQAQQTAIHNYEEKWGLKDGQKREQPLEIAPNNNAPAPEPKSEPQEKQDLAKAIAAAVAAAVKPLHDEINSFKQGRITETRQAQIAEAVGKLPEPVKNIYKRISVDKMSDNDFDTLMGEIKNEAAEIASSFKQRGVVFGKPAAQSQGGGEGKLTKEQVEAISKREGAPDASGQPF